MEKKTDITAMSTLTFMFFSFGFVTAMNNVLIPFMKSIFDLSDAGSMVINMAWYGAYAVASIPASHITENFGYKNGIIVGLIICAFGGFMYYPAAAFVSFSFFLVATFILAIGITLLQVAVNPFIVEVGPQKSTAIRMNIVGTANSSASMIAPAIGGILFLGAITFYLNPTQIESQKLGIALNSSKEKIENFCNTQTLNDQQIKILSNTYKLTNQQYQEISTTHKISDTALISQLSHGTKLSQAQKTNMANAMKIPYLSIGFAFLLVAFIIIFIKLPKIKTHLSSKGTLKEAWSHDHLKFGAIAIFLYLGLEIAAPSFMIRYASDKDVWGISQSEAAKYVTFYFLAMLFGRFSGIFVMKYITDKQSLSIYSIIGIALIVTALFTKGPIAIIALVISGICQSVMWGNIFSLATVGLKHLTNKATSLMLTAIAGGGILTVFMGFIADNWGVHMAFGFLILLYAYMIWYAFSAEKLSRKTLSSI